MYQNYCCTPKCYSCTAQNCCPIKPNCCPPQPNCCPPTPNDCCRRVDRCCCEPRKRPSPLTNIFAGVSSASGKRKISPSAKTPIRKKDETSKASVDKKKKVKKCKKEENDNPPPATQCCSPPLDETCDCCRCSDSSIHSNRKVGSSNDNSQNSFRKVSDPKESIIERHTGGSLTSVKENSGSDIRRPGDSLSSVRNYVATHEPRHSGLSVKSSGSDTSGRRTKQPKESSIPLRLSNTSETHSDSLRRVKNLSENNTDEGSHTSLRNSSQKQQKNKKNYEYQDKSTRTPMEVIAEEEEGEYCGDKSIQDTCADFLNIVNDSVLETVQKTVECMLEQYFCRTMERIDGLCSHLMRNDCLISKMYIDLLDKICQQNEKSQLQFKCLCEFLIESKKEPPPNPYAKCYETLNFGMDDKLPGMQTERTCTCGCTCNGNSPKHSIASQNTEDREKGGYNRVFKYDAYSMTDSSLFNYPTSLKKRYAHHKIKQNKSENSLNEHKSMRKDLLPKPHSDLQLRFTLSKNLKPKVNISD